MKQSTYYATLAQYKRLRRLSFGKGLSMSHLIRCALDEVYFDEGEEQKQ